MNICSKRKPYRGFSFLSVVSAILRLNKYKKTKELSVKLKSTILLLGMIVFLIGCGGQQGDTGAEVAVPVSVQEIKKKPIEEFLTATGTVKAIKEATLKSETSGLYRLATNPKTGKPYGLGDFVPQGAVIIYLDNPELESSIMIESKKLELEVSKQELEKQKSLYEKGGATYRDLKNAEKSYMNAQYSYENAKIQLAKLKIVAPFGGVIVDLPYFTSGVKVDAGQTMVKMMNYRRLYMEVNLPGKWLGQVKENQPVRVMNYTMPEDTLPGRISQVSPALDSDTRSFKSTILVENPDWKLRPGMFAKAEIVIARKDSAIVIPKDVILVKRRGKTVFVAEKGAALERVISTGLENPDEVEVTDGLKENERLVIKGFETLRHRSKVKIIR
ncbi:MAG: efflux RND transporter periplasmic adaptor subunit [Calditrichaeota bacterium]|nr:efflux RND transporter periplasmic adaptor subunit [Calditrichota bacterium]